MEQACENTHKKLEEDIAPYCDLDNPDRGPFYKYKDSLMNKTSALVSQFENFSKHISNNDKYQFDLSNSKKK